MKMKDLTHHFPIAGAILEVQASTKKKQGYIKIAIPDELINHLMAAACDQEVPISHLVIAYHDKRTTLPASVDNTEEHD